VGGAVSVRAGVKVSDLHPSRTPPRVDDGLTPSERFLLRLPGKYRRVGDARWMCQCPAHDDKNPSLSLALSADGKLLMHCFAGCETPDILAAVGLEWRDLWPFDASWQPDPRKRRPNGKVIGLDEARLRVDIARAMAKRGELRGEDVGDANMMRAVLEAHGADPGPEFEEVGRERALPWIAADEWVRDAKAPQWLIPGIMEMGTLNVLIGGWGAGKSLIGMDQPLRLLHNLPWQGKTVPVEGLWVYVVGEAQRGFQRRVLAWHRRHGVEPTSRFIVIPEAVLIGSSDATVAMRAAMEEIQEQTGQPIIGVTLDTLARCFGLDDENSNSDMGKWLAAVQYAIHGAAPDAAVCVLHHPGHGDKGRGRGASALPGASDKEWLVERQSDVVVMRCTKSKDDGVPEPMAWQIRAMDLELEGVNVSVPVLDETEPPADGEELPPKLQTMLDVLVDMYAQARRNLEVQDRPTYEAKVDRQAWFEQCVSEGVVKQNGKATFRSYARRLKEAGVIRVDDPPWVYPSVPRACQ
jgi:hypothetical protein